MNDEKKKPQSAQRSPRKISLCVLCDLGGFFRVVAVLLAGVVLQTDVRAHVGSPDVFLEGQAGPYRLLITVRPPHAIPGVADVDVLTTGGAVRDVRIVPLPLTGPGAQFAPVADRAQQSSDDPRLFTGHLWLMGAGAWQVRVTVTGERGEGTLSVPVPTLPQSTLAMSASLRAMLFVLMFLLAAGFVGIISALAREARLAPGDPVDRAARTRGWIAGAAAAALVCVIVFLGNSWWSVEASNYDSYVYKPLSATSTINEEERLTLRLTDPGWIASRRLDDFVPDHGHLMHLFVVSPDLDRLWHLHPDEKTTGVFEHALPEMPAGTYELFGDIVHATGVSETVTGTLKVGAVHGAPLSGDDSTWSRPESFVRNGRAEDGSRIVWVGDDTPLVAKKLTMFTFRVEGADGTPARDLELYMGMPGHAIFMRRDRKVFAHVHPSGSAPMAAMNIAMPDAHAAHQLQSQLPSTVTFPYGFPAPGAYVIFVQMKRSGRVITSAFDATVP